jgi:2'-5' RNA ligase
MPATKRRTATTNPAFVVVDIPEPARSTIQSIRDRLGSLTAKLPVEITLAGSSGVEAIPPGTDLRLIKEVIGGIATAQSPFFVTFSKIEKFPTTGVFYLAPRERAIFDDLHRQMKGSKIPFSVSGFPYNPHCTLRSGPAVSESQEKEIFAIPFPRSEILIDTFSVYELDSKALECSLIYRSRFLK